jgi:hypothetical protein
LHHIYPSYSEGLKAAAEQARRARLARHVLRAATRCRRFPFCRAARSRTRTSCSSRRTELDSQPSRR